MAAPAPPDLGRESPARGRLRQGWRFPVVGLRYQRPLQWCEVWKDEVSCVDDLFEAADASFCEEEPENHVVEIYPQPHMDSAAFLIVPPWAETINRIPICLQIHRGGRPPLVSMEYVDSLVFGHDLRGLIPAEFSADALYYIGDRHSPLGEHSPFHPTPGILVRVFPPRVVPRRQETLAQKLTDAWNCFRDIDTEGPPGPDDAAPTICALALAELPCLLPVNGRDGTVSRVQVAEAAATDVANVHVVGPATPFDDITLNGIFILRAIGALTRRDADHIVVFVDPRFVAQHIRVAVLPPVPISVLDFLHRSNVLVPSAYEAVLLGIPTASWHGSRFVPPSGACIRVEVRLREAASTAPPAASLRNEPADDDGGPSTNAPPGHRLTEAGPLRRLLTVRPPPGILTSVQWSMACGIEALLFIRCIAGTPSRTPLPITQCVGLKDCPPNVLSIPTGTRT